MVCFGCTKPRKAREGGKVEIMENSMNERVREFLMRCAFDRLRAGEWAITIIADYAITAGMGWEDANDIVQSASLMVKIRNEMA